MQFCHKCTITACYLLTNVELVLSTCMTESDTWKWTITYDSSIGKWALTDPCAVFCVTVAYAECIGVFHVYSNPVLLNFAKWCKISYNIIIYEVWSDEQYCTLQYKANMVEYCYSTCWERIYSVIFIRLGHCEILHCEEVSRIHHSLILCYIFSSQQPMSPQQFPHSNTPYYQQPPHSTSGNAQQVCKNCLFYTKFQVCETHCNDKILTILINNN